VKHVPALRNLLVKGCFSGAAKNGKLSKGNEMKMTIRRVEGLTFLGSICTVCDGDVDTSKAIPDYEIINDEIAADAVVVHTSSVPEEGYSSNQYYHGNCYLQELAELEQLEAEA
jgi:hypothetical protein